MGIKVEPSVLIAGEKLKCKATDIDSSPVIIEGFSIKWGRDEYSAADASPASVDISMIDTTGEWASRIRSGAALGLNVEIRWTGKRDSDNGIIGPVVMFRGRIQSIAARPHRLESADGRSAWEIDIKCADATSVFGNAIAPADTWPHETMAIRAGRIRDLGFAAGSNIPTVKFWAGHNNDMASPLDVKNKSALDLMGEFYRSMSNETWTYDPDANEIKQAIRLSQVYSTYLATFDDSLGSVIPVASDISWDDNVYPGIGLGGCELQGTPEIESDPSTDINRVEVNWKDQTAEFADRTTAREQIQPGNARRTMAWESWLSRSFSVNPTVENVLERAREEGRRPRHPSFSIHAGFEFVSERVARWVLSTWENIRPAFISGNLAYEWLLADTAGYSPVVAPIGGETSWHPKDGWHVDLSVHWIHNKAPTADSSATWQSLMQVRERTEQPSYPWWWPLLGIEPPPPVTVGDHTPERDLTWGDQGYHFGESVTWGDLQHVPTSGTQIKDIIE